jgi:hypothetical protein
MATLGGYAAFILRAKNIHAQAKYRHSKPYLLAVSSPGKKFQS